jgi:Zn-dependent protease with chaperone function
VHHPIKPAEQPKLFEFLYTLADKAGAPRPYKVFLSARVNASVSYDLSIINFFFPSRKNLEIGLGLVNALNKGEFRAVLAHEFGHFAQKAMAVNRWVYIAQQVAAHVISRRDKLDDFLRGLSRSDIRIAWVGWALGLIVWSIRSLLESLFELVVLMQRALSREMEMQADLVAVSLTGSDALIHALHRLQSADDSWTRAINFIFDEKNKGRITRDLFSVQAQILVDMGKILNDPSYNAVPTLPLEQPETHRVFKAELAQPPQMWLTHPLNHDRERNAKKHYVSLAIEQESAWELFDNPATLREKVTEKVLDVSNVDAVPSEETLRHLGVQFDREHLKAQYFGIYLGRSISRYAMNFQDLYSSENNERFEDLYPESLRHDVETFRKAEKELQQLHAIESGRMKSNGSIHYQGQEISKKQLPYLIAAAKSELDAVSERLQNHDRACRSLHRDSAAEMGNGWSDYLQGLLAIHHYADHTQAELRDVQGLLANAVNVETVTRRVSADGVERIVAFANQVYYSLEKVFSQKDDIVLDQELSARLNVSTWSDMLGEFKFVSATKENINDWLKAVDSWVDQAAGSCGALRSASLDQLLSTEEKIAEHAKHETTMEEAPSPSKVPGQYDKLLSGHERKRQTQLSWWTKFQIAHGIMPATARFLVAGGVVGAVLGFGGVVGNATITVYNGLARPVTVKIGPETFELAALSHASKDIQTDREYKVQALTKNGQLIEAFDAKVEGSFAHPVYNVAAASPLVEWVAAYGNAQASPPKYLGSPRWITTSATTLFTDPPASISTKGGGAMVGVLSAAADIPPTRQIQMTPDESEQKRLIEMHARWDMSNSKNAVYWLAAESQYPEFKKILTERLADDENDVIALRMRQDAATPSERETVCATDENRSRSEPKNADLKYVAVRCIKDEASKDKAFMDGYRQFPENAWFAYAAGYVDAQFGRWDSAVQKLQFAQRKNSPMAESVSVDLARIYRVTLRFDESTSRMLLEKSPQLQMLTELESGLDVAPDLKAYSELKNGSLSNALVLAHKEPEREARMIRLVGASDDATPAQIQNAMTLPLGAGLDDGTIWSSIALAVKLNRDVTPYLKTNVPVAKENLDTILQFMRTAKLGGDLSSAERSLNSLPPELRGHAYAAGLIVLGKKAPTQWRNGARRLLFASERPYFSEI